MAFAPPASGMVAIPTDIFQSAVPFPSAVMDLLTLHGHWDAKEWLEHPVNWLSGRQLNSQRLCLVLTFGNLVLNFVPNKSVIRWSWHNFAAWRIKVCSVLTNALTMFQNTESKLPYGHWCLP
jgi:hypothetical protein